MAFDADVYETKIEKDKRPFLCYIHVEFDRDKGWIIELPQIYPEGIEYENIQEEFTTKQEVFERAKQIQINTGLQIVIYNKTGSDEDIINV